MKEWWNNTCDWARENWKDLAVKAGVVLAATGTVVLATKLSGDLLEKDPYGDDEDSDYDDVVEIETSYGDED